LAKTIQDAINLTKKLRMEYLWVDTLYIVQDDEEDWVRESKYIGQIYSGAIVTFAAVGADFAEDGLFSLERNRNDRNELDMDQIARPHCANRVVLPCRKRRAQPLASVRI
jgi:hypothetical protein